MLRQAGDSGQLYGSVATRDIAAVVTEGGFSIERRQVLLDRPIKSARPARRADRTSCRSRAACDHQCRPFRRRAARQARGEQVTGKAMDEAEEGGPQSARVAAEKLFEEGAGGELAEGAEETAVGGSRVDGLTPATLCTTGLKERCGPPVVLSPSGS